MHVTAVREILKNLEYGGYNNLAFPKTREKLPGMDRERLCTLMQFFPTGGLRVPSEWTASDSERMSSLFKKKKTLFEVQ